MRCTCPSGLSTCVGSDSSCRFPRSQIKEINVNPDPPAPGKNLTVNVKADVLKTIEVGLYSRLIQ